MKEWPIKDAEEIITATYDFTDELDGATISAGTPAVTVTVIDGTDASPSDIKSGAPAISEGKVLQKFEAGVDGVKYKTRCRIDTSDGRRLVLVASLPVRAL